MQYTHAPEFKSFRKEDNGNVIPGGVQIVGIINTAVTTGAYASITLPTTTGCKAIFCKMRDGSAWKARVVGTTDYISVEDVLSIDIALLAGETLFQVQAAVADGTFEVMLLD